MIQKGNTIVYKTENFTRFFWLCDIMKDELLFFSWYANLRRVSPNDYWRMSTKWFNEQVEAGKIEIYDSLPLDKYGDVFEQQAIELNN